MNITEKWSSMGMNQPGETQYVIHVSEEEAKELLDNMEDSVGMKLRPKTALEKLAIKLSEKLL